MKLMRLVAAGRTSSMPDQTQEADPCSDDKGSAYGDTGGTLRILSCAVEALAANDPSANNMVLQLCIKDLMTSATGVCVFVHYNFTTYKVCNSNKLNFQSHDLKSMRSQATFVS